MAYDESLFEKVADVGSAKVGKVEFSVILFRYNGGEVKIKAQRVGARKGGEPYYTDVGNMTADEAEALAPLLVKGAAALRSRK